MGREGPDAFWQKCSQPTTRQSGNSVLGHGASLKGPPGLTGCPWCWVPGPVGGEAPGYGTEVGVSLRASRRRPAFSSGGASRPSSTGVLSARVNVGKRWSGQPGLATAERPCCSLGRQGLPGPPGRCREEPRMGAGKTQGWHRSFPARASLCSFVLPVCFVLLREQCPPRACSDLCCAGNSRTLLSCLRPRSFLCSLPHLRHSVLPFTSGD